MQSDTRNKRGSPTDVFLRVWVVFLCDVIRSERFHGSCLAFCLFTVSADTLEVNTPGSQRRVGADGKAGICLLVGFQSRAFAHARDLVNSLKASRCDGGETTLCKIQAEYSEPPACGQLGLKASHVT